MTSYYAESEQIPTVCSLGVLVAPDLSCKAAGGVIVQLLPFAAEHTVKLIEENVPAISNVSSLFDSGLSNKQIADIAFRNIPYDVFDEYDVSYLCDCSRDRLGKALTTVDPYELYNIFSEQHEVELCCQFCNRKYRFTASDVEKYRAMRLAEETDG